MWDFLMLNFGPRVLDTGCKELRKMIFVYFRILFTKSDVSEISISRQNLRAVFRQLLYKKQGYQSLHS
jgi:hypothetical protein